MPVSDIYRDYHKNDAQQLALLREKVQATRGLLCPAALAIFDRELSAWQLGCPPPELVQLTWAPDYWARPVPIREFIYEPYYLGQALRGSIYPRIVDDLEELFDGNYQEVILGGAQRWGKSVFAQVGIVYEIYRVSLLRDPGAAFGSLPGTKLAFVNASLTIQQARRVIFEGLFRLLKQSPYFLHFFPHNRNIITEIRFRRGPREDVICYPVAANEQAFMGIDIFSAAIDEANFMSVVGKSKLAVPGEGDRYDQVEAIYNRLLVRLKGSWNQKGGGIPGHMWLISSARYPGDFTERKEAEAKENKNIFVRHYALWDTKPDLSRKTFPVEVGDVTRRSRVLDEDESQWPADVNRARIIQVPSNFRDDFKRNPEKCVRDLAGISVLSVTPFIPRREAIRGMFELGTQAGLKPTFSQLEVTLQNPVPEVERLLPENLHWVERHKQDPMGRPLWHDAPPGGWGRHPVTERVLFSGLYYAHVDLSKTSDATGLVVGHTVGSRQVPRLDPNTMATVYEMLPIIRVDLALRIIAPPNGEIDIPKVRALLYQLRNLGMEFGLVTFDTYASQESVKSLADAGFTSDVYSVDTDFTPWEQMKQALYDQRLMCYEFPHLEQELAQLERTPKKIDHPARGGKDVADCLAAVVHHAEEGWRKGEGARNMFQMGIMERPGQIAEPTPVQVAPTTKVVMGQTLTPDEEDTIVFADLDKLL
jgi:hypothetical protein